MLFPLGSNFERTRQVQDHQFKRCTAPERGFTFVIVVTKYVTSRTRRDNNDFHLFEFLLHLEILSWGWLTVVCLSQKQNPIPLFICIFFTLLTHRFHSFYQTLAKLIWPKCRLNVAWVGDSQTHGEGYIYWINNTFQQQLPATLRSPSAINQQWHSPAKRACCYSNVQCPSCAPSWRGHTMF